MHITEGFPVSTNQSAQLRLLLKHNNARVPSAQSGRAMIRTGWKMSTYTSCGLGHNIFELLCGCSAKPPEVLSYLGSTLSTYLSRNERRVWRICLPESTVRAGLFRATLPTDDKNTTRGRFGRNYSFQQHGGRWNTEHIFRS